MSTLDNIGDNLDKQFENHNFLPQKIELEDIDFGVRDFFENLEIHLMDQQGRMAKVPVIWTNKELFAQRKQYWQGLKNENGEEITRPFIAITKKQVKQGTAPNKRTIPFQKQFTYTRERVFDGTLMGYDVYKVRQPVWVDCEYEVRLVTSYQVDINIFYQEILRDGFSDGQGYMNINGHQIRAVLGEPTEDNEIDSLEDERVFQVVAPVTVYGKLFDPTQFEKRTTTKKIILKVTEEGDGSNLGSTRTFGGQGSSRPFRGTCDPVLVYDYLNRLLANVASGGQYIVSASTVTDVTGNTLSLLAPGENFVVSKTVCDNIYGPIENIIINSNNCQLDVINQSNLNPDDSFTIRDISLSGNSGLFSQVPMPSSIMIDGANILSADTLLDCVLKISVEQNVSPFPIILSGSSGCVIDTITTDPNGAFELPDTNLTDSFGNSFTIPAVTNITLFGQLPISSIIPAGACAFRILLKDVFPINLVTGLGCLVDTIQEDPEGSYQLPGVTVTDDNDVSSLVFIGSNLNIKGGTVSAITSSNFGCETNIFLDEPPQCFPIKLLNSDDCQLDTIESCPANSCTGYTWQIVISGRFDSVTNLRLLDCDGENYKTIPFLDAGSYTFCHASLTAPIADETIGTVIMTNLFESCPTSYKYQLPDATISDENSFSATTALNNQIIISGASISSVSEDSCSTIINITGGTSPFPISILNTSGCTLDVIEQEDVVNGQFIIKDTPISDSNGVFITATTPSAINIIGADIVSATTSFNGCQLDITVDGGGSSTIIPRRLSWQGQQTEYTPGDTGYWYQQGAYTFDDGPGLVQDLDWDAANPNNIWYTLKYLNIFGSNRRFTTSTGIVGSGVSPASFTTADWAAEVAAGGIDRYVIDHLTGIGYLTDKITINENWFDSVEAVHSLFYGGFSDWRPLNRLEAESIIPFGIDSQFHSTSCILTRGGFFVTGNETQFWLGDTRTNINTNAMSVWDSGDVRNLAKSTASTVRSIFACRRHF